MSRTVDAAGAEPADAGRLPTAPLRTLPVGATGVGVGANNTLAVGNNDPTPAAPSSSTDDDVDARAEELLGRVIAGRYELTRVLGRGGMGIVYEARHATLGQRMAVKVLRADLARSSEAVSRFHREAKAAAQIRSEHIVDVFDFGQTDDGFAYIAMELLEGEDLRRMLRREGALTEARTRALGAQIARALAVAHKNKIVHRDLKSENVFVLERGGEEHLKLLDFGISKIAEGDSDGPRMTVDGAVLGTPHYMAPEQISNGTQADHRIDIYALGCLLYEMSTGALPFTGSTPVEVVYKQVHEAPRSVRAVRPELSASFAEIVERALKKNRDERWPTADAVLEALETEPTESAEAAAVAAARARSEEKTEEISPRGRPSDRGKLYAAVALFMGLLSVAAAIGVTNARGPSLRKLNRIRLPRAESSAAPSAAPSGARAGLRLVHFTVVATPASARVKANGIVLPGNVVEAHAGERVELEVDAPGYAPQTRAVRAVDARDEVFVLRAASAAPAGRPARAVASGEPTAAPTATAQPSAQPSARPSSEELHPSPYTSPASGSRASSTPPSTRLL